MAESTLSPLFDNFRFAIGRFLGFTRSPSNWDIDQEDDILEIIDRGLRQFYTPPILPGEQKSHEWTFLKPTRQLLTVPDFAAASTRLISYSSYVSATDLVIVTADSSAVPFSQEMQGQTITVSDTTAFTGIITNVTGVSSSDALHYNGISIHNNSTGGDPTTFSAKQWAITSNGCSNLPDDYGGIEGLLTYNTRSAWPPIEVTNEARIRTFNSSSYRKSSGRPLLAAVRPRDFDNTPNPNDETVAGVGSRFEMCFYPIPDSEYTLNYRTTVMLDTITSSATSVPGGMLHGETILASMLAIAEQEAPDMVEVKQQRYFFQRLAASVALDRQANKADNYGYNWDRSDGRFDARSLQEEAHYHGV